MDFEKTENLIYARINRTDPDYSGIMADYYEEADHPFYSLDDLMNQINDFCDQICYPEAWVTLRSFRKAGRPGSRKAGGKIRNPYEDFLKKSSIEEAWKKMERARNAVDLMKTRGDLATFVVHVRYRQNASMQGTLVWVEGQKEMNFRSVFEMSKLMDSTMKESREGVSDEEVI